MSELAHRERPQAAEQAGTAQERRSQRIILPPRSTAGQLTLDQHIGVRIPGGQPTENKAVRLIYSLLRKPEYDVKYDIGFNCAVRRRASRSARSPILDCTEPGLAIPGQV
jgi:hypothetical protein